MKRLSLGFLACASPLLVVAPFVPARIGSWLFALLSMLFPVALIAIGGALRGGLGRLGRGLVVLALLLEGGAIGLLLFHGASPRVAGLPLSALWALVVLGALPLIVTATLFAADFDRFTARSSDRAPGDAPRG